MLFAYRSGYVNTSEEFILVLDDIFELGAPGRAKTNSKTIVMLVENT
jgi:hypothetical protein